MKANHQITPHPVPPHPALLPADRVLWPADAEVACARLAAELDQWSRENDCSREHNAWVAEEAVRRAWAMEIAAV